MIALEQRRMPDEPESNLRKEDAKAAESAGRDTARRMVRAACRRRLRSLVGAIVRTRMRRTRRLSTALWAAAFVCLLATAAPAAYAASLAGMVEVPIDHLQRGSARAALTYELGAPFAPQKPTVFVVADAQQSYVRSGAMTAIQDRLFGDGFNVVGVFGRGMTAAFVRETIGADGKPDWRRARRIFASTQWIEDIEAVRRKLVGRNGKIMLYGRSGGGLLVHEYLARYGGHVTRAWTQAPLNPFIVGELGLWSDRFWEEIGAYDRSLQPMLSDALKRRPEERTGLIRLLQRQNFFVPLEGRDAARASLIRAIASDDRPVLEKLRAEYQVDQVDRLLGSADGIAIAVRIYEFFEPSGSRAMVEGSSIHPDLENQARIAGPLLALQDVGAIEPPQFDTSRLHLVPTEVMVLAARHDHTADYRAMISLAARYPNGRLFLADDNHVFEALNRDGVATELLRAFLAEGARSERYRRLEQGASHLRWR